MIPRRAREPLGVGLRSLAGEPQILCTFQLDTRSYYRFVSGTPRASGAPRSSRTDRPWSWWVTGADHRSDTARPRHRDCSNHRVTDNETIDNSG